MGPPGRHAHSGLTIALFLLLAGYFVLMGGYLATTGLPALQAGGVTAVALLMLAAYFQLARV